MLDSDPDKVGQRVGDLDDQLDQRPCRDRARAQHHRRRHRGAGGLGTGRRRRAHPRGREDHLQLLRGAARRACRRDRAHVESCRRPALRACTSISRSARQDFNYCSAPLMGDEQRVSPDELIAQARARFESATDFTVAVEEEFAILDPESLDLTNRFEDLQAAARGPRSRSISSASSSRPRSRSAPAARRRSPTCPRALAERRAQLRSLAEPMGLLLGATGHAPVGGLEEAAHHRHAALPPQRRAPTLRRLAQQHVRAARPRRGQRARPRDRGRRGHAELPPRAARALGELAVRRGREHAASTRRARRSSRASSRAAASPTRSRRGRSTRASCASSTTRARSPSTRSSGGACGRTSPFRPSRSGSATASPSSRRRRRSPRSRRRSSARIARAYDEGSRSSRCRTG